MSHSWTVTSPSASVPAVPSQRVEDPRGVFAYQVRWQEEQLVQEESLDNVDSYRQAHAAAYLVGSGNHAQTMVSERNGYLHQLPLGWFSHEGVWKLNPGYELKNHRFDRPILSGCLACHGGYAPRTGPAPNRYELPVVGGITCEQCHGPGADHVDQARRPEDDQLSIAATIVNPAKLSSQRANDVCLQCHLQGDVVLYRDSAEAFSFRPGDRLSDHRLDFLIEHDGSQDFGVASHGAGMLRSRCYTATGGRLTCIHCHDPHRPVSDFTREHYDERCAACHDPEDCGRSVPTTQPQRANGCVACHMPRRDTREGQHLVFTDHWIRVFERTDPIVSSLPPLLPDADVRLTNPWPEVDPHQAWLGMACVQLHETMGPQQPALERGLKLLKAVHAEHPDDLMVRYYLASGLIARHEGSAAVDHLSHILERRPHWHEARFRLGVAWHQQNRYTQALREYSQLIQEAPDWLEPYPLALRIHLTMQNPSAALRLVEKQISYYPDVTAYLNLALARQGAGRSLEESLAAVEASLCLDPRNAEAYVVRAYLYAGVGQKEQAQGDYRRALEIDPDNRDARAGLSVIGNP